MTRRVFGSSQGSYLMVEPSQTVRDGVYLTTQRNWILGAHLTRKQAKALAKQLKRLCK